MSGFATITMSISTDLKKRLPAQRATQRRKLSELVAGALICQSPNLMELSNVLDRPTESAEVRYNYVERFLKNPLVKHGDVMGAYAKDILTRLSKHQRILTLMIDQSKINKDIELLMISVRVQRRAVPIIWCAKQTKGAIGFSEQKKLLDIVNSWLPAGCLAMLLGDRFYGSSHLIDWCCKSGWDYRLRLKSNLYVVDPADGNEKQLSVLKAGGVKYMEKVRMRSGVKTSIGILHEKGHPEAWYVAMSSKPSALRVREYSKRWGIENMFSDFKSRGFSIMHSQLKFAERLQRLVLVLSIALHWAVSVGFYRKNQHPDYTEKKEEKRQTDHVYRFLNEVYDISNNALRLIKNHQLYGYL